MVVVDVDIAEVLEVLIIPALENHLKSPVLGAMVVVFVKDVVGKEKDRLFQT